MRRLVVTIMLLAIGVLGTGYAATASADSCSAGGDPLSCACQGSGSGSSACSGDRSGTDPISGNNGVLVKASRLIASIAGVVAVIIIIVAGLTMVMANGDTQRVATARSAIIGALVGALLIIAAAGIITLVVNRL